LQPTVSFLSKVVNKVVFYATLIQGILVKFIESIGMPFSILKLLLRTINYSNNLTIWFLVLLVAASLMNGITVYSESINLPNSNRIVATVPVGSRPHSIDFGLDKVFITNSGSNTVSVIDGKTDRVVATIPVGADPHGIAATYEEDGNNALDSNLLLKFPYTYVANTGSNTVSVIDGKTDRVVATIPVGADPHGIIVSNTLGKVYVTNSGSNTVSVIDGKMNKVVAKIPVGSNPHRLALFMSTVYVTNSGSNTVSVIDGKTDRVVATIPVDQLPRGIAVDSSGFAYTTNKVASSVSIIDGKTNKVVATIPVGRIPNGVVASSSCSFNKIYITNSGSNSVSIIAG
jgi:YVTN family beta-propeller protein